MNTALLVTAAVCVGVPALAAAVLLAWQRHPVLDAPDRAEPVDYIAVDCEDHDEQPSPEEELMLRQVEAMLVEEAQKFNLARAEDLDLDPVKKAAIRRRVLAGQSFDEAVDQVLGGGR